jgi:hypothetical protein
VDWDAIGKVLDELTEEDFARLRAERDAVPADLAEEAPNVTDVTGVPAHPRPIPAASERRQRSGQRRPLGRLGVAGAVARLSRDRAIERLDRITITRTRSLHDGSSRGNHPDHRAHGFLPRRSHLHLRPSPPTGPKEERHPLHGAPPLGVRAGAGGWRQRGGGDRGAPARRGGGPRAHAGRHRGALRGEVARLVAISTDTPPEFTGRPEAALGAAEAGVRRAHRGRDPALPGRDRRQAPQRALHPRRPRGGRRCGLRPVQREQGADALVLPGAGHRLPVGRGDGAAHGGARPDGERAGGRAILEGDEELEVAGTPDDS